MHQCRDGSLAWSLGVAHSGSHWRQLRQWRRPDHIGSTEHRIRRGNSHSNQAKYACTSHVARACQPASARLEPAIPQPLQRVQPRSRFLLSAGIGTGGAEHHALQAAVVLGGSRNERAAAFARKNRTHPTSRIRCADGSARRRDPCVHASRARASRAAPPRRAQKKGSRGGNGCPCRHSRGIHSPMCLHRNRKPARTRPQGFTIRYSR